MDTMMVERTQQLKCNLGMISNQNISRLGARQPNNFRWLQLTLTILVRWWLGGWDSGWVAAACYNMNSSRHGANWKFLSCFFQH